MCVRSFPHLFNVRVTFVQTFLLSYATVYHSLERFGLLALNDSFSYLSRLGR